MRFTVRRARRPPLRTGFAPTVIARVVPVPLVGGPVGGPVAGGWGGRRGLSARVGPAGPAGGADGRGGGPERSARAAIGRGRAAGVPGPGGGPSAGHPSGG